MVFSGDKVTIELTQSQFKDENILSSDSQKFDFLSYEQISIGSNALWGSTVTIKLSEVKRTYERSAYTLLGVLSDLGGFADLVYVMPMLIIGIYSE